MDLGALLSPSGPGAVVGNSSGVTVAAVPATPGFFFPPERFCQNELFAAKPHVSNTLIYPREFFFRSCVLTSCLLATLSFASAVFTTLFTADEGVDVKSLRRA